MTTLARGSDADVVMHDVAILFCDIRGFTTMAEKLSVAEVARVLGEYFERACDCVLRHGGHHLKVMGDGLMAVFDEGPAGTGAHARQSLRAALDLVRSAADFQAWLDTWLHGRGLPDFAVGVGVHAGEVIFGRLGSGPAAEVTPLGDAVNVAARLEAMSKDLGWAIVASAELVARCGGEARVGRQAEVNLRGRSEGLAVCEVLGLGTASSIARASSAASMTLRDRVGLDTSPAVALEWIVQAVRVLGELHAGGRVLAYVKPESFAIDEGGTLSLSAVARRVEPGAEAPFNPYYSSPETLLGASPSPASDFYGLGVVLHELLTGRLPFGAESVELLVARHARAAVPPLPEAAAHLQPLFDRLLAKQPGDRFASAAPLLAFIDGMPAPARRA